jgi:chromosome segregation ATPase
MPWWTWIALGFFAAVVLAGVAVALLAFRALGSTRKRGETLTERVDDLARRAEALQARLDHADERSAEVQRHTERLERSLERLSVLTWALGDARRGIARIRAATTLRK